MSTGRPTAKQAIEVLKIHQLRRENAAIFEQVKGLREDVTIRQTDLNEARKDISKAIDDFKQIQQTVLNYETRLTRLEADSTNHATRLKEQLQTHESFRQDFLKAFEASNLQSQNAINVLVEKVTVLKDQVVAWEKTCADSIDELRDDLASRAEKGLVAELEDKLEDFMQEIDARFESLQKINCVTDSLASRRNQQTGEYEHIENASSPTATRTWSGHSSDSDHWRPIDTQTALRATPPPMPETLIQARPREDTVIQTPSTLRSNDTIREAISNIIHTRPASQQLLAQTTEHVNVQAVPLAVAQQQALTPTSEQRNAGTDWSTLNGVLKLRQGKHESLAQYLTRYQVIVRQFPADGDVVSVCLKRLVIGMVQQGEKQFVREWLTTSDWTLENLQDCLLLLRRRRSNLDVINTGLASHEFEESRTGTVETSKEGHDLHKPNILYPKSQQNLPEASPLRDQFDERLDSRKQRVQPARAAKTQKTGKPNEGKKRYNTDANISHRLDIADDQQRKPGQIAVNTKSAFTAEVSATAEPTNAQQDVAIKNKSRKNRLERELKSLTNTDMVQKPTKGPKRAQKRKALHQPTDDLQPASRLKQDPQTPLARRNIVLKRVPTLVARGPATGPTVAETSDALRLPSMPNSSGNEYGQKSQELGVMDGTTEHRHARKLPMLSLSTGDFEE